MHRLSRRCRDGSRLPPEECKECTEFDLRYVWIWNALPARQMEIFFYVLLEFKIATESFESIALTVRAPQEFAVLDTRPTVTVHVRRTMSHQHVREVCWEILVKQYSHLLPRFVACVEDRYCQFALHGVTSIKGFFCTLRTGDDQCRACTRAIVGERAHPIGLFST